MSEAVRGRGRPKKFTVPNSSFTVGFPRPLKKLFATYGQQFATSQSEFCRLMFMRGLKATSLEVYEAFIDEEPAMAIDGDAKAFVSKFEHLQSELSSLRSEVAELRSVMLALNKLPTNEELAS